MDGRPRTSTALDLTSTVKIFAAVLAANALIALIPGTLTAQTTEDAAAVREQVEAYRLTWNTHDAAAVGSFFTEDADFVMGNLPAVRGRQAERTPVRYARATWVLVREDNEWLITALWVLPSEDDQIIREGEH